MKKIFPLLVIAILIGLTPLFAQNRETRKVGSFTKVAFRVPGKLYLKQGSSTKVEIEGSKEMLSIIETEVDGSSLLIHTPRKWNWRNDEKIAVYITVKDLEAVSVAGSGDLIGESKFNVKDISLAVSGSGSMKLEIESAGEVKADVSGSGNLSVRGTSKSVRSHVSGSGRVLLDLMVTRDANFNISGSGKIEARGKADEIKTSISGSGRVLGADFEVTRCDIRISGSGSVEIHVKEELEANISGSGSVSYRGNPSRVNSSSSGSGRVRKM
jgi:hypothetical protein